MQGWWDSHEVGDSGRPKWAGMHAMEAGCPQHTQGGLDTHDTHEGGLDAMR